MADKPLRILLVAGEPRQRRALEEAAGAARVPMEFLSASSLAEAREILLSEEPEAVVASWDLPDGTADALSRSLFGTPAIAVTEPGREEDLARAANPAFYALLVRDREGCFLKLLPALIGNAVRHRRSESRLAMLSQALAAVGESVCVVDMDGKIIYVNRAFGETYGYEPEELEGSHVSRIFEDESDFREMKAAVRKSFEGAWEGESYHLRKDGGSFPVNMILFILKDERGRDASVVGVIRPVREDRRLDAALTSLSRLDGLTNLPDRNYFEQVLEQEWRRARRLSVPLSVVLIDIDHFRNYNDLYGQREGDSLLIRLGREICGALKRPGDLAARRGGEEFAVLLPGVAHESAVAFSDSLRSRIEGLAIPHQGSLCAEVVTVSLGTASAVPDREGTAGELEALAERALREAKNEGRNRVKAFSMRK